MKDDDIISTGYNHSIIDCKHYINSLKNIYKDKKFSIDECPRKSLGFESGEGKDLCPAIHAETDAILKAAKHGISMKDSTMYMTCGIPCKDCLNNIINSGISKLVCIKRELFYYDELSKIILDETNLDIKIIDYEVFNKLKNK